jgi:hypothetical protein
LAALKRLAKLQGRAAAALHRTRRSVRNGGGAAGSADDDDEDDGGTQAAPTGPGRSFFRFLSMYFHFLFTLDFLGVTLSVISKASSHCLLVLYFVLAL